MQLWDTAAPPASVRIPAGTPVELKTVTAIESATARRDQEIALRLAEAVGVAPTGTEGVGVVLDAAPARLGGRPGKIVVAGIYKFSTGRGREALRFGVEEDVTYCVDFLIAEGVALPRQHQRTNLRRPNATVGAGGKKERGDPIASPLI